MRVSSLDPKRLKFCHGGDYRKLRAGRKRRPLSARWSVHVVLKADKALIPGGLRSPKRFRCAHQLLQRFSYKFFVKIEQSTIQNDHIHLLVRSGRRANLISFFRVIAGQIAQQFLQLDLMKKKPDSARASLTPKWKLWKNRPFTRVVLGDRAYKTVRDYLQLNELEVTGVISYRKDRLRGLNEIERKNLWNINELFRLP